jgi:hypothetical protein
LSGELAAPAEGHTKSRTLPAKAELVNDR